MHTDSAQLVRTWHQFGFSKLKTTANERYGFKKCQMHAVPPNPRRNPMKQRRRRQGRRHKQTRLEAMQLWKQTATSVSKSTASKTNETLKAESLSRKGLPAFNTSKKLSKVNNVQGNCWALVNSNFSETERYPSFESYSFSQTLKCSNRLLEPQ